MDEANNHYSDAGPAVSDRMRELLARAATEQGDEQRAHGAALHEIRQRLEGVEWALHDVREREVANLSDRLDFIAGRLKEMAKQPPPEWAERLAEHMEAIGEKVTPVAELPSLWADVGVVAESVDEALGRIQTIVEHGQENTRRFEDLGQRFERLQASIDTASTRFDRLEKSLTTLNERAERLERGMETLGQRIEQGLEGIGNRIEGTAGRLDGLDGRLDGIQGRLDGVDGRLGSMQERLEHLPAALDTPEIHRRLSELAERPLPDPTARLADLDERLREAESHVVDAVDGLSRDVRARPERAEVSETVTAIVESARQESTQRLAALEDSVIALAEALLNRNQADTNSEAPAGSENSAASAKKSSSKPAKSSGSSSKSATGSEPNSPS